MILIIAEKPSVMKNIIDANLEPTKPRMAKGCAFGKNFIYTHCIGHLLTLKMPGDINDIYKKWDLSTLPFEFDEIPLEVNKSVSEQYKIVEGLMNRDDILEVVNACDSDREGDLIFRNLYHYVHKRVKKVSRMWIESQTPDGILESFEQRLLESEYNNVYFAGKSRSYADYIIGLNATRAMTTKFGGGDVLTIGRVQTPTLRIICDLENEIKNFKPEDYFKIKAIAHKEDTEINAYYIDSNLEGNKFKKKEDALKVIDDIGLGDSEIIVCETNKRYEKPKSLYSLSDLQIDMDKRYKMSAMDVLNTAQALYETHKLITYPRTDENHISESLAKKTYQILQSLVVSTELARKIINEKRQINKSMISKKDIGAHEALTPTTFKTTREKILSLNDYEKKVYMAIVERFLAAFLDDAVLEKQKIEFVRNGAHFQTEMEICISLGHREAYKYGKKPSEVKNFLPLKKGDIIKIDKLDLEDSKTTPPSRFSEGSLIRMMKNPSKYVESKDDKDVLKKTEGIGTEATRAQIIVDLKNRGFIELDKKKSIIATKKGLDLIQTIPGDDIKSVSLTAMFERKLDQISKGEYDHNIFLQEIKEFTKKFVDDIKDMDTTNSRLSKVICKCPLCGCDVIERDKTYSCSNKECMVYILKNALGAKLITRNQAANLLTKGESGTKVLCKSKKTNHDFEALMRYEYNGKALYPNILSFDFGVNAPSEEETISLKEEIKPLCKCPACSSGIIDDKFKYYCSNKECRVLIYKNARGAKNITKKDAKELFLKGITSERVKVIINDKETLVYLKYSYDPQKKYPNQIEYIFQKEDDK